MTKVETKERSPSHIELRFNSTGGMPTYVRGILREAHRLLGTKDAKVDFVESAVFSLSWS